MKLGADPTRFLSTIQIGITSIGILNGIVGKRLGSLMAPRADVVYLDVRLPFEENLARIESSDHARFPVVKDGGLESVMGVLNARRWLSHAFRRAGACGGIALALSAARRRASHLGAGGRLNRTHRWPALRGGLIALIAALLFGVSTPLVQRFGVGIGSFATAALLYAGAVRRVTLAMALLTPGGMALVLDRAEGGASQMLGLLAVMVATAAWGVDNTLSRAVADRDPGQVVMFKGAIGAIATTLLALAVREPLPGLWPALALLAVGATGYGLSLRFYLLAQRAFGAARTGSVFAFAPFVGALSSSTRIGIDAVAGWNGAPTRAMP